MVSINNYVVVIRRAFIPNSFNTNIFPIKLYLIGIDVVEFS